MARTAVLGFPRIGPDREFKFALEDYWRGKLPAADLAETAAWVRSVNLGAARLAGIDVVAVGDFAYYDHVLDAAELVGLIAPRHGGAGASGLDDHFLAATGAQRVAPLRLARWFGTGYHFLVPELADGQTFGLRAAGLAKWIDHLREARALGIDGVRPVLLGPLSLLALSESAADPLGSLPALIAVYKEILAELAAAGATEVQLDEPTLVLDLSAGALDAFSAAYADLLTDSPLEVALVTTFGGLDDALLARIKPLRLAELHVDLVEAPDRLDAVLENLPEGSRLSAGIIDGRNVWAVDADRALAVLDRIVATIGSQRLTIATSCSLLHVPYGTGREQALDPDVRSWLAFGEEKLAELALLARAVGAPAGERDQLLAETRGRIAARSGSPRTRNDAVRMRAAALSAPDYERSAPIADRLAAQADRLALPELPTTTIGSLPQTTEIRRARLDRRKVELSDSGYVAAVHRQIDEMIEIQEMLELDVLVHGEPERSDPVEYFCEQLDGFAETEFGWVQTYGSRAVKPSILYGDVVRSEPMVAQWWRYAQSRTERPVKGTVTGPVTILQRSFVRDDQPREETCRQIALAIHDEVVELEAAGAAIIQIDEPALLEGLPLRNTGRSDHIGRVIDCLRLTAAGAGPQTQIHMHLCQTPLDPIVEEIPRLGAEVISIDASRLGMRALEAFAGLDFPGALGPGLYDIHARRIASAAELEALLELAEELIPRGRLWVNPACGLKTRPWPETIRALTNLVQAAHNRRAEVASAR